MTTQDILDYRLTNQQLATPTFTTPQEIVSWLGAVQAQDYSGAKWALVQRLENGTDEAIEQAFTDGHILRTHVMRPTWHFVAPHDIRWLVQLTAPRVKALMAYYDRELGLTADVLQTTQTILRKSLGGGKALSRDALSSILQKNNLPATGQALAHVAMHAELDGVICSGPRKDTQFTYMLLEERAPTAIVLKRDEALTTLTKRYFTSHGPATVKDFAWWSGLTIIDAKKGLAMNRSILSNEIVDGKEYWFAQTTTNEPMPQTVYLLPNYDENTIAYKDRNIFFNQDNTKHLDARGNMIFHHVIMLAGEIIGVWRRTVQKETVQIEYQLFTSFGAKEHLWIKEAFTRYGKFLNKTIVGV